MIGHPQPFDQLQHLLRGMPQLAPPLAWNLRVGQQLRQMIEKSRQCAGQFGAFRPASDARS